MKRILLVAGHELHGVQLTTLEQMFDDKVSIEHYHQAHKVEDWRIVKDFKRGGYDDIIAILPFSKLDAMAKKGVKALYPEAITVSEGDDWDWDVKGRRYYRFVKFKRVEGMLLDLEDLGNDAKRNSDDTPEKPNPFGTGKKVMFACRWKMEGIQVPALKRLYGNDVAIIEDGAFCNAKDLKGIMKRDGYDDIIAVVPLATLDRMVQAGIKPLWADAEQVEAGQLYDWKVNTGGGRGERYFYFKGYKRVTGFEMKWQDLGEKANRCD